MKKFGYLLSVMVVCGGCLFGCTSDKEQVEEHQVVQEEQTKEDTVSPEIETSKVEEKEEVETPIVEKETRYHLGDTIELTSQTYGGDVEVIFTNAYFTDYRNEFEEEQPDKVLVVEYQYKNISFGYEDGFFFCSGLGYDVYGEDGFILSSYPYYTDYSESVSIGRSSKGSDSFNVYGDQHHFEIEVGSKIVEFDVE